MKHNDMIIDLYEDEDNNDDVKFERIKKFDSDDETQHRKPKKYKKSLRKHRNNLLPTYNVT